MDGVWGGGEEGAIVGRRTAGPLVLPRGLLLRQCGCLQGQGVEAVAVGLAKHTGQMESECGEEGSRNSCLVVFPHGLHGESSRYSVIQAQVESWEELTCILLPLLHAPLMDRRRVAVLSPPRAA